MKKSLNVPRVDLKTVINLPVKTCRPKDIFKLLWGVGLISPLAYLLILLAITHAPLSYIAPLREISMLIGLAFGATLLKEAITPRRALGSVLMMLGVLGIVMTA